MDEFHYKHKDYLMTRTEHDFFKELRTILGQGYYIFPQIHLGTIIKPSVKWTYRWRLWRVAFFYSDRYSVDFVICDTQGIKPLLVIELDDISHQREKRRSRDRVVEKMLRESNLPIVRFTSSEAGNIELVDSRIRLSLQTGWSKR